MKLLKIGTGSSVMLYIAQTTFDAETGIYSSEVVEELGSVEQLKDRLGFLGEDEVCTWANLRAAELSRHRGVSAAGDAHSPRASRIIEEGLKTSYNVGHLFLFDLFNRLGLRRLCADLSGDEALNDTTYALVAERVISYGMGYAPEKGAADLAGTKPLDMHLHDRCLSLIAEHLDAFQRQAWESSKTLIERDCSIVYLDRMDYLLQDEKSARACEPVVVDMGLAEDASLLPVAFEVDWGRHASTLAPLERRLNADFGLAHTRLYEDVALPGRSYDQFFRTDTSELSRWAPGIPIEVATCSHLLVGFIALLECRIIQTMLTDAYSLTDIISKLREMRMEHRPNEGWRPLYVRDALSDALHDAFGFRTDYEVVSDRDMERLFDALIAG